MIFFAAKKYVFWKVKSDSFSSGVEMGLCDIFFAIPIWLQQMDIPNLMTQKGWLHGRAYNVIFASNVIYLSLYMKIETLGFVPSMKS